MYLPGECIFAQNMRIWQTGCAFRLAQCPWFTHSEHVYHYPRARTSGNGRINSARRGFYPLKADSMWTSVETRPLGCGWLNCFIILHGFIRLTTPASGFKEMFKLLCEMATALIARPDLSVGSLLLPFNKGLNLRLRDFT